ncbi:hypothetical protein HK097_008218 [Rhizophlyctis rosea]|uniref:Uncharacterized protein n=1 Tax=Rhizophlyctis rosea TaxID=64517 RepID=A0AAD5X4P2_9FUNG|nr:hypothetical protein HK097_008218 [Rhizophlyctis rosea]
MQTNRDIQAAIFIVALVNTGGKPNSCMMKMKNDNRGEEAHLRWVLHLGVWKKSAVFPGLTRHTTDERLGSAFLIKATNRFMYRLDQSLVQFDQSEGGRFGCTLDLKPGSLCFFKSSLLWHGNLPLIDGLRFPLVFFNCHFTVSPISLCVEKWALGVTKDGVVDHKKDVLGDLIAR